jgi:hypothetical protein
LFVFGVSYPDFIGNLFSSSVNLSENYVRTNFSLFFYNSGAQK